MQPSCHGSRVPRILVLLPCSWASWDWLKGMVSPRIIILLFFYELIVLTKPPFLYFWWWIKRTETKAINSLKAHLLNKYTWTIFKHINSRKNGDKNCNNRFQNHFHQSRSKNCTKFSMKKYSRHDRNYLWQISHTPKKFQNFVFQECFEVIICQNRYFDNQTCFVSIGTWKMASHFMSNEN